MDVLYVMYFRVSCVWSGSLLWIFIVSYQAISEHVGAAAYVSHHSSNPYVSHLKDLPRSPHSAPKTGYHRKVLLYSCSNPTHSLIYTT